MASPQDFDFSQLGERRPAQVVSRKKAPLQAFLAFGGGMLAVFLIAVLAVIVYSRGHQTVGLRRVANQQIDELKTLNLQMVAEPSSGGPWRFELAQGPQGAAIHPKTGQFTWKPTEAQGPGWYDVAVRLVDPASNQPVDQVRFGVGVVERNEAPVIKPIEEKETPLHTPLTVVVEAKDPDEPAKPLRYRLSSDSPEGATIDGDTGVFHWTPTGVEPGAVVAFTVLVAEAVPNGLTARQEFKVRITAPGPGASQLASGSLPADADAEAMPADQESEESDAEEAKEAAKPSAKEKPAAPEASEASESPEGPVKELEAGDKKILALHEKKGLFHIAEYPTLRKIFADRFEQAQQAVIRQAWGEDYDAMAEWAEGRPEIRDEFYTAIDPEHDNIAQALTLFRELKKQFPRELPSYTNLAIAIAVTWDDEQGIYEYVPHQQQAKSTLPEAMVGPIESFRYFLDAENAMQGRAQFLPWEFLAYVVDHRTPLAERSWALVNYLPKRVMIGRCYAEVPYDKEMVLMGNRISGLQGKPYTLPNLRQFGGASEMQADFAARVAKCLGVPAAYVEGRSRYGESHAWVLWIELLSVAKNKIKFTVQSFGRDDVDRHYVGTTTDPHTGRRITDREIELRLHTVGMNAKANRQAGWIMKAYPMLRDALELDAAGQLAFLNRVIKLCPGHEQAWLAIARISREGQVPAKLHKPLMATLDKLFRTFAYFPDFTWKVFDDLIAFQEDEKQRAKLYERLMSLYETAGRPDLACEARLKYADYLVEDGRKNEAIQGLATSIQQIPEEGRYVPKMLDRLEELCKDVEGSQEQLVRFYQEFLPRIPQMRDDRPSPYCIEMFERGIERFKEAGREQLAKACETQLTLIKAGRGRRR